MHTAKREEFGQERSYGSNKLISVVIMWKCSNISSSLAYE